MESRLFMIATKELLKRMGIYLKNRLWERVKKACLKAWDSVKEDLWNDIKVQVKECAAEIVTDAETFLSSIEAQEKEKLILDLVMTKIELPLLLKPFKGLVRKVLQSKLEETVRGLLEKAKEATQK